MDAEDDQIFSVGKHRVDVADCLEALNLGLLFVFRSVF